MNLNWQRRMKCANRWQMALSLLFYCGLGVAFALLNLVPDSVVLFTAAILLCFFLTQRVEVALHELGHLLFARLSGYEFGYFGLGDRVWLRRADRLLCRRYSLAGAAGYCMMYAPEVEDPPFRLYYLGGVLMDLCCCLVCFTLLLIFPGAPFALRFYLLVQLGMALYSALNNAFPHFGLMFNDGRQLRSLSEDPDARRAFGVQQRLQRQMQLEEKRLKDLPLSAFPLPPESTWSNHFQASLALMHVERLRDAHRFAEARQLGLRMLASDADLSGMQRLQLTADCICFELLLEHRPAQVAHIFDPFLRKHLFAMKKNPGMLRSAYICQLLMEHNPDAAAAARRQFDKLAKASPWQAELQIDLEMMDLAQQEFDRRSHPAPDASFRRASLADLDAIAGIYDEIHAEIEAGRAQIGWIRAIYPTRQTAESAIQRGEMYVQEAEGRIVAAARINQVQGPEYAEAKWSFDAAPEDVLVLHTLVVSPSCAGKGYGSNFVAYYENLARQMGCSALRMDTNAINAAARSLYKKLGYAEACIVPTDFNGIPDVQLVCLDKKLQGTQA